MRPAGTYNGATLHTSSTVTKKAMSILLFKNADPLVSIEGGSTVGLGKALSIRTGLPHICIPTTDAGSEMTHILAETGKGKKTVRSGASVVIYDVDLTISLPSSLSATSGVNTIAHAAEALYATIVNPITTLLALEAIRATAGSLPQIIENSYTQSARERAQYGAWLCGMCLGASAMALHHKVCHTLDGFLGLPNAEIHAIMLPHVLAYNSPKAPNAMSQLAMALPESCCDAINGLNQLLDKLKVKRALNEIGMKEEDMDKAAKLVCSAEYPNPRQLEEEKIRQLIRRCWTGEPASADS